jgi:NAD(P)-dependent dehydrogenase (short-subunit alcohol dehydrogenase family)
LIDSERWAIASAERQGQVIARGQMLIPGGQRRHPEEIASLIAWLLGPDGGWVAGQIVAPNGGVCSRQVTGRYAMPVPASGGR